MKFVTTLLFAICIMSASCGFLKEIIGLEEELDYVQGTFPTSFYIQGNMVNNTHRGNATFRFDGYHNAFSYSFTYNNTKVNVTDTDALYFAKNMTYHNSTDDKRCTNRTMQVSSKVNITDFIENVWAHNTTVVYNKTIGGHNLLSYNIPYSRGYNMTFHFNDTNLYKVNGTAFNSSMSLNVTKGVTAKYFDIREVIPKPCLI